METPVIERPTARVLVLDPANRILLFQAMIGHSIEPERRPEATGFWALPGGGIEPGESPEQAARRELREETGMIAADTLPMIAVRDVTYPWKGRQYRSREHFFFHRSATVELDASGWLEGDKRWMRDLGWWTLESLATTVEIVRPPGIAALAARLSQGLIPPEPVMLEA